MTSPLTGIVSASTLSKLAPGTVVTWSGTIPKGQTFNGGTGLILDFAGATVPEGMRLNWLKDCTLKNYVGGAHLDLYDCQGVTAEAPRFVSGGLYAYRAKGLTVDGLLSHGDRGFYAEASSGVTLRNSRFAWSNGDGVNVNSVSGLLIEDVAFDGGGRSSADPWRDDNIHPDAIQGWGSNRDVTIRRVRMSGRQQGIFFRGGDNNGQFAIEDVVGLIEDYKWLVTVQGAEKPPTLKDVRGWGMTATSPKPALDFRFSRVPAGSPLWTDGGGNLSNGQPITAADVMR